MAQKILKTEEMKKYELVTGKNAIWNDDVTKGFVKWQKGERIYDIDKERVALYIPKNMKEKWISFANNNNYSTLTKLIKEALEFYIHNISSPYSKRELMSFNLYPNLSHDLKEQFTTIIANLELLIDAKNYSHDYDVLNMLRKIFAQCLSFEEFITYNLENIKPEKEMIMNENESKYDILIIEDNIETLNFLTRYLTSLGYSCKEARSGTEGLKTIKESKPSIILLDIILPDIIGYDVVKSIRSNVENKEVKIIFLTAVSNSEAKKKMDELGVDGLILKPFRLNDFGIIDNLLGKNKKL